MKQFNQIKGLILLIVLIFCNSVMAQSKRQNAAESWYFLPKSTEGWHELKPQRSYRVKPIFIPRYTAKLNSFRFKKIGWAEAQAIVGNSMEETKGFAPYLVRGLMINDGTGGFEIWQKKHEIWVAHVGLGQFRSYTRQPLVVILRNPPTEVYTDASTDL